MFFVFGQNNFNYFFHNIVFGGEGRGLLPGRALRNAMLHSCARIETCTKSCDEFLKDRCLENVTKHKTVVCVARGALIQTIGQENSILGRNAFFRGSLDFKVYLWKTE